MRLRALTAAALTALCLLGAPPAAHGWREARAVAVAAAVWAPPCELRVRYGDPAAVGLEAAGGWAWEGNCEIWINRETRGEDFELLCHRVLHEAGHVVGAGHSPNPRSVMHPGGMASKQVARVNGRVLVRWDGVDRRCLHRGRPYLASRGLL